MKRIHGLLQVGGASKNAGKTSLVVRIIESFAQTHNIIAVKISCHVPNSNMNEIINKPNYVIFKENNRDGLSDTSKMINFGAKEVYFICAKDNAIKFAFEELLSFLSDRHLIVCESNSLSRYVVPDVFLLTRNNKNKDKKSAEGILEKSDLVLNLEEIDNLDVKKLLSIHDKMWFLNKK